MRGSERSRRRFLLVIGLLVSLAPRPARAADSVVACTLDDIDKWRLAQKTSLGVKAADRMPILAPDVVAAPGVSAEVACPSEVDFAGDQDGRASDGIHDWVFAAPCKVTACGEAQSFEQNRGLAFLSGEYDLNSNIAVEGDFEKRYLKRHLCFDEGLDDLLLARPEPRLCFPPSETLHAEITPARRLRPLFRRAWTDDWPYGWVRWKDRLARTSPWSDPELEPPPVLEPRARVCAYGPFVADTGHAARAEIHPVQLLWWKESEEGVKVDEAFGRVGRLALFVMQDASARYTKAHHFVLSRAPASGGAWRPWAEAPVDGSFTVPFWSDPSDPPRFRLDPYEYLGTSGGAPASVACNEQRVTALAAAARPAVDLGSPEDTVASFCKAVAAEPPSKIDVDVRVDCYCDPGALKGGECPGRKRGYLGRIVVRAETGRRRDWSEGSLAMLLWDQRPLEAASPAARAARGLQSESVDSRSARQKTMVEALQKQGEASGILTWKPSPGSPWTRVVPKGEGIVSIQATIDRLFDEADWPSDLRRPLPSLWRLLSVDLHADAVVEDLGEKHRKSKKVSASFEEPLATRLIAGPGLPTGEVRTLAKEPATLGGRSARLAFPKDPEGEPLEGQEPWRIQVPVTITVDYVDRQGRAQKDRIAWPPKNRDRADSQGRWTVWTHGLGAEPLDDWNTGVRALCDRLIEKKLEKDKTPVTPPRDDLRTIVRRATKDGIVSVTELKLMVKAVKGLCAGEDAPRSRPIPVQSK